MDEIFYSYTNYSDYMNIDYDIHPLMSKINIHHKKQSKTEKLFFKKHNLKFMIKILQSGNIEIIEENDFGYPLIGGKVTFSFYNSFLKRDIRCSITVYDNINGNYWSSDNEKFEDDKNGHPITGNGYYVYCDTHFIVRTKIEFDLI